MNLSGNTRTKSENNEAVRANGTVRTREIRPPKKGHSKSEGFPSRWVEGAPGGAPHQDPSVLFFVEVPQELHALLLVRPQPIGDTRGDRHLARARRAACAPGAAALAPEVVLPAAPFGAPRRRLPQNERLRVGRQVLRHVAGPGQLEILLLLGFRGGLVVRRLGRSGAAGGSSMAEGGGERGVRG